MFHYLSIKLSKMDKLQKFKVALRESERWFRGIFKQTFGFIGLMQPIGILMEGNQTALKFAVISSSKVIHCPLWEACLSDFSPNVEDFSSSRGEAGNFRSTLVGNLGQMPEALEAVGIIPKIFLAIARKIVTQVWRSLRKLPKFQQVGLLQIHK